ncbi:MAG: hypothetical protein V5804_03510 [Mucilaginibacter sp.]|uniref:hypothetical protein n=1 Tax=Mucilaginibacter sp. TaxID=1882438 RepID=UPI0034E61CB7
MKHSKIILPILFFSSCLFSAYCQSTVQSYKGYDIRNSSCEIINAVNLELGKPAYTKDFQKLLNVEQAKYPLQTQINVEGFINDFNITLDKTKKQYEAQEFLWKTGKEIGKYGLSVLGNYAQALPTKHLTNFLTPAIQQGYELYVDDEINKGIEEHKNDVDNIIKNRINLLYSNGIDVRTAADEQAFTAMFEVAHGDIPALNRDMNGTLTKELTKRAYDFLAKNRTDLQLLNLKTTQQYEEVKQEVNSKTQEFQKELDNKFKELGDNISDLMKNQDEIYKTLDNIKERVEINEKRVTVLENEMLLVKDDINLLKSKQDEHDKILAQNAFQIDILSGYTFQNLNTTQKIKALEKGHFDNIFKDDEKQKLLGELKDIKTKETIISVSSDIENYSKGVYGGLVNAGVLKGKAAQNVGKLISVVSIVTGVARVYAGDISGLASIVSGIGGLLSKPTPSPEMQMLTQMYEVMNQRFDNVDKHLDRIETKLDTLSSITVSMYKTMVLSFQYTGNQLERINWKINTLNTKATTILYRDYQACKTLKDIWGKRNVNFSTYSDYQKYYNQTCQKCLEGLNDFTIGKNLSYFFVSTNGDLKDEEFITSEIRNIYEPTLELFKVFYSQNLNSAMYSLMFPYSLTKDVNKPLYIIAKMKELSPLDSKDVIGNYFSYEMINEFTNMITTFGNYFQTAGNNTDFKPVNIKDYLQSTSVNGINQDLLETRLLKILNITQYSISQQSLMAGNLMLDPIYSTLFSSSTNQNAIDLCMKVLNNNKLLATNFDTYLINKNINFTDTLKIKSLFKNSISDSKSLDTLNSLIIVNDIKFAKNETDKNLHLSFSRNGQEIKILCPDFETILSNKMINSDAIYSLLESRQKINSKLIDLTFPKNLETVNAMSEKFKYLYKASQ